MTQTERLDPSGGRGSGDPTLQAQVWTGRDGAPISCREKLKVLEENRAELAQVMQDAFEDAILMDVDADAMRRMLHDMVASLRTPLTRSGG